MGLVRHEASILLLQGKGLLSFLDGLSTNHVAGPCTTVFTTRAAKIIDVCDIVPVGEHVAIVGHAMNKNALAAHLAGRILGQAITITDISELNDVFIDVGDSEIPPDATVHTSFLEGCSSCPSNTIGKRHGPWSNGMSTVSRISSPTTVTK